MEQSAGPPHRWPVITALGITQIFAWGTSYYLFAVLAAPIARDTGWSLAWIIGGLSLGLVVAGIVSPHVGRVIAIRGGRPVLSVSAVLLAAGLLVLSLAHHLPVYLAGCAILGAGMGTGLYDPAFATLGRLYGDSARNPITVLTLFGGLASTVCWPLSAFLEAHVGWRGTCLAYAIVQLGLSLPLYLIVLPYEPVATVVAMSNYSRQAAIVIAITGRERRMFVLLAVTITLGSVISAVLSVHLLTALRAQGIALATAVSLGALVGPSQVAARAIEMAVGRFHHPIWTKVTSVSLVAAGVTLLWSGNPLIVVTLMLYGGGIGLESIARGTLPLAVFGQLRYPVLMGRIARPSLIAQAAAPSIGALLIERTGVTSLLATLVAAAALNVLLVVLLVLMVRSHRRVMAQAAS